MTKNHQTMDISSRVIQYPLDRQSPKNNSKPIVNPAIFSFFSGAGFLDLGFELSGFSILLANDINTPFISSHQFSREQLKIPFPTFGYSNDDIRVFLHGNERISLKYWIRKARQDSGVVGFIGGPPCPDFAVGGKNKGAEGENGILTSIYFDLIVEQKPDFFVFENVKGLWKTARHRTFYDKMKERMQQNGFITTERLINAIEYGVPQDRDRIILIGFSKQFLINIGFYTNLPEITPDEFGWKKYTRYSRRILKDEIWPTTTPFAPSSILAKPEGIQEDLTVEYWFNKNNVYNHPNTDNHFIPRAGLARFMTIAEGDDSKKSYKRLHRWRYSPTAAYGNNEVHLHPNQPRRITVAEALAIQSLPREFVLPQNISLSHMFKAVGNGVPFLASKAIAKTLKDFICRN